MTIRLTSPRWQRVMITSFLYLCLLAAQPLAQSRFVGEGHLVALDAEKGTVTLDHGPIPGIRMKLRG